MGLYTPTYKHIAIEGCATAKSWIARYLMGRNIDFQYCGGTSRIEFVQAEYDKELTTIQRIISDWEIVEQFRCNYETILDA